MTGEGKRIITYTIYRYYAIRQTPHRPPPKEPCIHFYTYGRFHKRKPEIAYPVIKHIECVDLKPPSSELCAQYTGLDRALSDSFFNEPANEEYYRRQKICLAEKLHEYQNSSRCLAVTVSCRMGMHRSVAMAERLAEEFASRGWKCRIQHLDLEQSRAIVEAENGRRKEEKAEKKRVEKERLKREAEDDGRRRSGRQEGRDDSSRIVHVGEVASVSPRGGKRDATTGQEALLPCPRRSQRVMPSATTGKGALLAFCTEPTGQTALKERVNDAPRNYYGKPAPEMIAGFKNTSIGWVPR